METLYKVSNTISKASKAAANDTLGMVKRVSGEKKDKYKTLAELVKDYDYPFERHSYETEDGYINLC